MYLEELTRGLQPMLPRMDEAAGVVRLFTDGPVWLVGGSVYRTIANQLYGTPLPDNVDLDFVIESLSEKAISDYRSIVLPRGWNLVSLADLFEYGKSWLEHEAERIDFWSIRETRFGMEERDKPVAIDEYLAGTSLTVQALGFNLDSRTLVGDVGIEALRTRTVRVNNMKSLRWHAAATGVSASDYVLEKARSLGFHAII